MAAKSKKLTGKKKHNCKGTKRAPRASRAQVPAAEKETPLLQPRELNPTKTAIHVGVADDFDDDEDGLVDLPPTDPTEEVGMSHFMEQVDAASSDVDDLLALRAQRKAERRQDNERAERQANEASRLSKPSSRQRAKRPQVDIPDAARLSGSDAPSWMKY